MATNTDKPVGPGTFTRGGNSVTIAEDGKILVQKNDWLSKYSYALYGDYVTYDVFVRPNPPFRTPQDEIKGIKEIDNPDRIETGEYLVHVPTWFSWAEKRGKPRPKRPYWPRPVPQQPDNGLDLERLKHFLRYLGQVLKPVNDWKFEGSSGIDISASIFAAHYCQLSLSRAGDPEPTVFHAVGAGVGFGLEDFEPGSISISPPDFDSLGIVLKYPWAGATLSLDEICGNYLVMDVSGGFMIGGSIAYLFFGFNDVPSAIIRNAVRYFRGEGSAFPILPSLCNGVVPMAGFNLTSPTGGISFKAGWMHRLECVPGFGAQSASSRQGA
jgi:hypothetical protein